MVPQDDEPFSYRERALMTATAQAVVEQMTRAYPPDQYGSNAFRATLKDYFGDIEPGEHKRHHGWVRDAMSGKVNQTVSWQAFWFDVGTAVAKLAVGGILMLIGMGLLDYLRLYLEVKK